MVKRKKHQLEKRKGYSILLTEEVQSPTYMLSPLIYTLPNGKTLPEKTPTF
jgi:hypothetical protein